MAYRRALNNRQLSLLTRIVENDDPVTSDHSELKTTVYALKNRALVRLDKTGKGAWRAVVTDLGREVVSLGHLPPKEPKAEGVQGHRSVDVPSRKVPESLTSLPSLSVAEAIRQIEEAGGTLRLVAPADSERATWRRVISLANSTGSLPDGKRIRHTGRDAGDMTVILADAEESGPPRTLPEVPVPERLQRPHSIVREFRDHPSVFNVSRAHRQRALLLLEAVIQEAVRRGFEVINKVKPRRSGASNPVARLVLKLSGEAYDLRLVELSDRTPHTPTAKELKDKERYSWTHIPDFDYLPNGRLEFRLEGYPEKRFGDRERWKLESRLPLLFAELMQRVEIDKQRREDRQSKAERKRLQWEEAMASARQRFLESHRAVELQRQIDSWKLATEIRRFCDQVTSRYGGETDVAWIDWARSYADRLDPVLNGGANMPRDIDPTSEQLRPFLNGLSPHGPF